MPAKAFTMQILVTTKTLVRGIWIVLLLASGTGLASAQSTDVAWPSPVRTNEVRATIAARDIGDPRITDHFFAFTGTPGDVLVTVDCRNLNGDIDVFTSSGLRPLLKFTVYAGGSSLLITKSIYLRQQEDLILRVEGRTPNDDDAVYRIHLGGSFEPITSGPLAEHEDAAQAATAGVASSKKGSRVSSVGARIDEPRTEVAEAPTPQPTPVESSEAETKPAATKPTSRSRRPRRPVTRKLRPAEPPKADETTATAEGAKSETETKTPPENTETEAPVAAKPPTRKGRSARAAAETPAVQEPEDSGPRLVIETNDGTLVDRYMSGVRRVTVENGQVVVVGKDGKIQRIPLASVVRMTISP